MTRVVLSIGSNLGDRMARLQAAVDGLGVSVRALSPVYETAAWGGVEQGPFLNAIVVADDPVPTATNGCAARRSWRTPTSASASRSGDRAPSTSTSSAAMTATPRCSPATKA